MDKLNDTKLKKAESEVRGYDRKGMLDEILSQFKISTAGSHGPSHWARVRHHGLTLGTKLGGNLMVIELFAFLHDSQRIDEYEDKLHGERAADYAASLQHRFFDLMPAELDKLVHAIRLHSDGFIESCPTVQSCWDADRLDLGRVGIKPNPKFLSKLAALEIDHAYEWSRTHHSVDKF